MAHKSLVRAGVLAATTAMIGLAAAPAGAATIVSQSEATAFELSIAGQAFDTGVVTATHDGTKETKGGGSIAPEFPFPGDLPINVGVLTQQAVAGVDGNAGVSAACAGAAGSGEAALIKIGDSDCLTNAENIDLGLDSLDLTGLLSFDELGLTEFTNLLGGSGLDAGVITGLLGQLGLINSSLDGVDLDSFGITASLGVLEARCEARPGTATGSANIAGLNVTVAGVPIINFDAEVAPNTKAVVQAADVVDAVLIGIENDLATTLNGQLGVLSPGVEALRAALVPVVDQLASFAGPLEENLIDITLNKQSSSAAGQIDVTALDLKLLPALGELGATFPIPGGAGNAFDSLISAQIASVSCGPNGTVAGPTPPADLPKVPTAIASGDEGSNIEGAVIAGLVALSLTVGVAGQRWYAAKR